jgi:2-furoyl-CoA dehydrogenase 2Fe-2S iron sulfur subunit
VRLGKQDRVQISLKLNGHVRRGWAFSRMTLCDFLRHELGATGTHVGCEHGVCGACTVRVDGVDTVEGLASPDGELNDLQAAFRRHHALQCGFCTAGILMSCADYLKRMSNPTEDQVREMLSGHLCRCTGYTPIVEAVLDVVRQRQQK